LIGYHFLFEGFTKLFSPDWTSAPFLKQSEWILSNLFHFIADSPSVLAAVDFINIWGQIFIGIFLIIGFRTRIACWAGAVLILLYYIASPPFVSNNFFLNRNLFEFFSFIILALFNTSGEFGIDSLLNKLKNKNND